MGWEILAKWITVAKRSSLMRLCLNMKQLDVIPVGAESAAAVGQSSLHGVDG